MAKKRLKCVSLFSGAGGLDLGLEASGFSTVFASDIDWHSCQTLALGAKRTHERCPSMFTHCEVLQQDIKTLDIKKILSSADIVKGELPLLAGGPPCQAFSVFGKRKGRDDPRGQMVFEYLRLLAGLEPQVFLFENVYGLLTIEGGAIFQELCEKLTNPKRGLKYELSVHRLNAVDFGVPQFRDRVFIIGSRIGGSIGNISAITAEQSELLQQLPSYRTVADAFRGLSPIGSTFPANHVGRDHSKRIVARYASLKPGQRDPITRINKLDLSKPSFTIIVGSDKGGGKGHVHPTEPREVTPRESARIQTFPDWWEFSGTSRHPIRQVGNAVPPLLAGVIGCQICHKLFGSKAVTLPELLSRLGQEHLFLLKISQGLRPNKIITENDHRLDPEYVFG